MSFPARHNLHGEIALKDCHLAYQPRHCSWQYSNTYDSDDGQLRNNSLGGAPYRAASVGYQ